jgi:phospholipid N-methyltransferase
MAESFLRKFSTTWKGGYFEGDPTDPMSSSSYGVFGYHSQLYLTYMCCIKPHIGPDTVVLELGPGRGAWTKAIAELGPKQIFAVDVVAPEYAGFWDYVGCRQNVRHIVVDDFSLSGIPDRSVDYFFSFGCFCHLKPEMCISYIDSLASKMKAGANGFLMIADYDKYNACRSDYRGCSIWRALGSRRFVLTRLVFSLCFNLFPGKFSRSKLDKSEPESTSPGAWFHFGVDRACEALSKAGFRVVERDMRLNHRDPIVHFVRM